MNPASLTVALRPRSAWEAVELGFALVRRHARAVWAPWLLASLPVLVLLNALAWSLDVIWVAGLLMWWLKPAFDRLPLYVLSRAVFGDVPGVMHTLRAQRGWAGQALLGGLTWRRLGPVRSLYLPIDLLEGSSGADAAERRRSLGGSAYGVAALVTLVCVNFEIALLLGAAAGVLVLVPTDMLPESARFMGHLLLQQPPWVQLALNLLAWMATCVIEPFYVAAGFAIYLNRRTELEGWDIELGLRRLRARLAGAAPSMLAVAVAVATALMLTVLMSAPMPAAAQDRGARPPAPADPAPASDPASEDAPGAVSPAADATPTGDPRALRKDAGTLPRVFAGALADDTGLREAVAKAYADPRVTPRRRILRWQSRDDRPEDPQSDDPSPLLEAIARIFALIAEFGAWALFGLLALGLLLTAPRWSRWMRNAATRERRAAAAVEHRPVTPVASLPPDIPGAVHALWDAGQPRDALALLYRASVQAMARRAGVELAPAATEAQCLRASRKLPLAQDRDAFAALVRTWQQAAYAQRLPDRTTLDAHLDLIGSRFGWSP